jgi:hypothetical protein
MTKRALFAVAGILGICFSVSAQQRQGLEQLSFDRSRLDRSSVRLPSLSLEERDRYFLSTAFGWTRPTADYLPTFNPWESQGDAYQTRPSRYPVDDIVDLRAPDRIHFGGEVGVFYGKSSGRYGREDFESYIIGTVGNEKFSITAGYLHRESNFDVRRRRR